MSHRRRLFEEYHVTHVGHLDRDDEAKARWFAAHVSHNYAPRLPAPAAQPRILEVGCSKGFMLAALRSAGYTSLFGLDLSAEDISLARSRLDRNGPAVDLTCADAFEYLAARPAAFDVIVAKAVLEHQEKAAAVSLLESMQKSLAPGGRVLLEVPNMDWFLAQHERYMDFTHETGFTRESLGQVLRLVYGNAEVFPVEEVMVGGAVARVRRRLVRGAARRAVSLALRALGQGAHETLWYVRSILGVAYRDVDDAVA